MIETDIHSEAFNIGTIEASEFEPGLKVETEAKKGEILDVQATDKIRNWSKQWLADFCESPTSEEQTDKFLAQVRFFCIRRPSCVWGSFGVSRFCHFF